MNRRRKQLAILAAVAVLFIAALAVWIGNPNSGHNRPDVAGADPLPSGSTSEQLADLPGASSSPSGSGSSATGGAGDPAIVKLPPVSGIQIYGPGVHTVVVTVTSNSTIA